MSSSTLDWFSNYLRGRQQLVRLGQTSSDWCSLTAGVPQGGILSPLMFSIFINMITSKLLCSYHLYADDLQLYVQCDPNDLANAICALNRDLDRIYDWSRSFGIAVNPNKCQAIILGSSRILARLDLGTLEPVIYNNVVIPYASHVKNLGLHIDPSLNWNVQVAEVSRKVTNTLRALHRFKFFLPLKTKVLLMQTLVLPILDYADVCYLDVNEAYLSKLDRLLNNCIRFIFGLRKYDHISEYRERLGWLTIRERRYSRVLSTLFSIFDNPHSPGYLKDNLHSLSSTHDRDLRSANNLCLSIPPHRTNFFSHSFTVQAARLWNDIPENIRKAQNRFIFKKLLKEFIMGKRLL